jgi:hypothetical protein
MLSCSSCRVLLRVVSQSTKSIRQHTSACASIRQHPSALLRVVSESTRSATQRKESVAAAVANTATEDAKKKNRENPISQIKVSGSTSSVREHFSKANTCQRKEGTTHSKESKASKASKESKGSKESKENAAAWTHSTSARQGDKLNTHYHQRWPQDVLLFLSQKGGGGGHYAERDSEAARFSEIS